jgi:hypothetical protein
MRRFLRYLRIAFSATCAIACVLLIVLWARSYWWSDGFKGPVLGRYTMGESWEGQLFASVLPAGPATEFQFDSYALSDIEGPIVPEHVFFVGREGAAVGVFVPHWFSVSLSATLAVLLWIHKLKRRFSLRTLLIATTLVAVVLGLVVYVTRQ